ncbi:hypothetical protein ACS0TY_011525 [Phlomoides rotata]
MIDAVFKSVAMEAALQSSCIFCQIARSSTSTTLLHKDDKIVAFQDINPSAFRHYLVIPIEHIPTVNDLQRRSQDFSLVSHMLNVGQSLLQRDAPHAKHYRHCFSPSSLNQNNQKRVYYVQKIVSIV